MSTNTGENEQGLRNVIEMTRTISIIILLLHFYYCCYAAFAERQWTTVLTDRLLLNIKTAGLFNNFHISKVIALGFLFISLIGATGRKDEKLAFHGIIIRLFAGVLLYFFSSFIFKISLSNQTTAFMYIVTTAAGFLMVLSNGTMLSRLLSVRLSKDIFNYENETFPQEERYLKNDYSINLPARYVFKKKLRKSWINIVNPFRGLLVIGSPGSGKSWFVIQHVIKQHIEKGFTMFVYDFKFDDLTKIAYNALLKHKKSYKVAPAFHVINFDDLGVSSRCNPLDPEKMQDITDATEAARTILLGLNREWIDEQGDFFVESPINFVTALIWFLRKYENGKYCTLPHVIELMQAEYDELFPILNTEPELEVLISPFITAYQNDVMEQLEGQIGTAKIGMARLASPQLYWVLSGSDFTLDINEPKHPKIVCIANNPEKQQIYGAVVSLYVTRLIRQVNKKGRLKSSLIFDEFPTIFLNHIDSLIATARSNKVATTLGMQDFSQLKKEYGKDYADVIMNITGNIISGQVAGETAKQLSERFGKILQDREGVSINRMDTSVSRSTQLDFAIPASRIASLSSGEFVGMVADDPDKKIKLKMFHAEIINNQTKLDEEAKKYKALPMVSDVTKQLVMDNYFQIKLDVKNLISKGVSKLKKERQDQENL